MSMEVCPVCRRIVPVLSKVIPISINLSHRVTKFDVHTIDGSGLESAMCEKSGCIISEVPCGKAS